MLAAQETAVAAAAGVGVGGWCCCWHSEGLHRYQQLGTAAAAAL